MREPEVHLDDLAKRFASSAKRSSSADSTPVKVTGNWVVASITVLTGLILLIGFMVVGAVLVK